MSNLRALLHHETLLATYDKGGAGVQTPMRDRYFTNPQNLDTDDAAFLQRPATNKAAPFNKRGAPARQLDLQGKTRKSGAMFHVFDSFKLSTEVFQGLREPDSPTVQRKARNEIADQMDHFKRMHLIQQELCISKILANGVVYVDQATGQIVESSGATVHSVDFGVPSAQQNTGGGLAQPFDDHTTDIEDMFEDIKNYARANNNPVPGTVICNSWVKPYIRANDYFQLFAANHVEGQRVLYGELVQGLFGMNWLFIDSQYEDSTGTMRKYFPDEKIVLVPDDNSWIQAVQGLELVPTTIDVGPMDAVSLANSLTEVYGEFGYGMTNHNPPSLDIYTGHNYGYILRDANALWQLDVKFS